MALVECWECGKAVSEGAPTCPHCGIKNPAWRAPPRSEVEAGAFAKGNPKGKANKGIVGFGSIMFVCIAFTVLGNLLGDDTPNRSQGQVQAAQATRTPRPTRAPTATHTPVPTPTPYPVPEISISAKDLVGAWVANEVAADNKYPGQVIDVYGTIIDVQEKGSLLGATYEVTLSAGFAKHVNCRFELIHKESLLPLERGQKVTVRGEVLLGNPAWVHLKKCVVPQDV